MRVGRRQRIVWVASYPKSGSTWMRMLLANFLFDSEEAVSINDLDRVLPGGAWFNLADFDDALGVSPSDCTSDEICTLLPHLYRERAARAAEAGRLLFCKTHHVPRDTPAGEPLFPEDVTAGAVYLVRNPLDVAVSWAFYTGMDFVASVAALNNPRYWLQVRHHPQWRQYLSDWSGHVRYWTGAPFPVLTLRYEDLLADAAEQLGRVARFLRLEGASDASRRRCAAALSGFDRLRRNEEREGFPGRKPGNPHLFFRSGRAGGWRRHLSAAQVREVVRAHGETMAAFGYDPPPPPKARPRSRSLLSRPCPPSQPSFAGMAAHPRRTGLPGCRTLWMDSGRGASRGAPAPPA